MDVNHQNRPFKVFHPGRNFPAISITGAVCELDCAHCGGKYLSGMRSVEGPEELYSVCQQLTDQGVEGALISGGCDATGQVMLEKYMGVLAKIKQDLDFVLNVHTGLLTPKLAAELGRTGSDIASVDIVGDSETIKKVYGLEGAVGDYVNTLKALKLGGIRRIVPHICIGLDYGKLKGEFKALDMIAEAEVTPEAIVFIILIPTPGSRMESCQPPRVEEVAKVIDHARAKHNETPLYLGCMRPKDKKFRDYTRNVELRAIEAGIHGIVLPSKETVKHLQNQNIPIETYQRCCAMGGL